MIVLIHSNAAHSLPHEAGGGEILPPSPATQSVGRDYSDVASAYAGIAPDENPAPIHHRTYDGWTPRRDFLW